LESLQNKKPDFLAGILDKENLKMKGVTHSKEGDAQTTNSANHVNNLSANKGKGTTQIGG
jgi:hypothetical protein